MMEGWLETGTLAKELSLLAWAPGLIGDFDRRTYARPVVSVAVSYP